jgi:hypothetical protein
MDARMTGHQSETIKLITAGKADREIGKFWFSDTNLPACICPL